MSRIAEPAAGAQPGYFRISLGAVRRRVTAAAQEHLSFGRAAWAAVAVLALVVILANAGQLRSVLSALFHADPLYLLAAAAFQAAFLLNLALFYRSTFAVLGFDAPLRRFLLLGTGGYFVNLVSKTSGLGGMGLYLNEGSKRGFKRGRTITAYMVTVVLGHAAYFATLALALLLLYLSGSLKPIEVVAASVIATLLLAVLAILLFATADRRRLEAAWRVGDRIAQRARRLLGKTSDSDQDTAAESAGDLYEAVADVRREPVRYARPLAHAFLVEALSIGVLFTAARALGADLSLAQSTAAYAVAILFSMAAVTPSGLGFVEASVAGLLVSFGVPLHHAIAASLAYRFFEFWVPLLFGSIALRALARGETST